MTRFLSELHRQMEEAQVLEQGLREKWPALEKREKDLAREWEVS